MLVITHLYIKIQTTLLIETNGVFSIIKPSKTQYHEN